MQVLLNLTRPYKKVTVSFLARELVLTGEEVESLLVDMILDQKLAAHIDQIKGHVILEPSNSAAPGETQGVRDSSDVLFAAINRWSDALALSNENFGNKLM